MARQNRNEKNETAVPAGFAQSRRIALLSWEAFRKTLGARDAIVNDTEVLLDPATATRQSVMNAGFELNSFRTHQAVWNAATRDPLSTVYSVAWTLCASLGPPADLIEKPTSSLEKETIIKHYYSTWYAFGLLHKYVDYLWRRVLPNNLAKQPMVQLFTLEQLLHADSEYVNSFEDIRALRKGGQNDEALDLLLRYEDEFLRSNEFTVAMEKTPFGSIQRDDLHSGEDVTAYTAGALNKTNKSNKPNKTTVAAITPTTAATINTTQSASDGATSTADAFATESSRTDTGANNDATGSTAPSESKASRRPGAIRIQYVALRDLGDRSRLTNSFKRVQIMNALRVQCERHLRQAFPAYASARAERTIEVNNWLFALLKDLDSEPLAFATADPPSESERRAVTRPSYMLYWQYQKSGLVWFLVHTLFALNDLARNDDLNADLLFFVSDHLETLIECGVCAVHWNQNGKPVWTQYREWYETSREKWAREAKSPNEQGSFYNYSSMVGNPDAMPDMYMLRTHNAIQASNVNPAKRLTDTCLRAIRIDYLQLAMAIEASVVPSEHSSEVDNRLDALQKMERSDVMHDVEQVFTEKMIVQLAQNPGKLPGLGQLREDQLNAERRRVHNALHGFPF